MRKSFLAEPDCVLEVTPRPFLQKFAAGFEPNPKLAQPPNKESPANDAEADSRGRAVTKLTRTFVIVAVGAAILAAGSVAAVKASVSFVQGFGTVFGTTTTEAGWNCTTNGAAPGMLLAPEGRWNGQWQPATGDVS